MAVKHVTRAHMGWTRLMFSAQKFFQLTPQQLRWRVSLLPFFRRGIREVELLAEDHEAGECWHQTLFTEETNIHSRSLLTGLPPGSQLVNLHSHFSSFPYYLGCVLANDTQAEVHKRVSEKLLAFLIKNLALYTFPRPLPSNGTVMPRTTWDSDKTKWYLKKPVMNSWVLHQSWTAYFQSFCFVGTIHLDYNLYPPRFPGSNGKESACNAGDPGSIPGLGRSPGGGHGNPLQPSCLENLRGQRSLAGYSSWGCKESDTTEQLTHTQCTCLQNPMDRGAWRATVHRVAKSRTWLKWLSTWRRREGGGQRRREHSISAHILAAWFFLMAAECFIMWLNHCLSSVSSIEGVIASSLLLYIVLFVCSVVKSCPTLHNHMDCSTPGSSVLHCLPKSAQSHVHWVRDAI